MPDTPAPDPVATYLAEVETRHGLVTAVPQDPGATNDVHMAFTRLACVDSALLAAALGKVLELAAGARVMLRGSPADCTNACFSSACDCSGEARVAGWDLDPEALRNAIAAVLSGETAPLKPCPRCEGCGQLADSDDREPWSAWLSLPLRSSAAVLLGAVKPVPCDVCNGSGSVPGEGAHDELRRKLPEVKESGDE